MALIIPDRADYRAGRWTDSAAWFRAVHEAIARHNAATPSVGDPARQNGRCLGYTDATGMFHPA